MRTHGTLAKWNAERGFGFIRTRDTGLEVFAHVSQFPRGNRQPQVGDPVTFEIRTADDGRRQAQAIVFETPATTPSATPRTSPTRSRGHVTRTRTPRKRGGLFATLAIAGMLGLGGGLVHRSLESRSDLAPLPASAAPSQVPGLDPAETARRCGGRTQCSQMRSCSDATWVLRHCPGTQMDGDGDGIPCEQQWCG